MTTHGRNLSNSERPSRCASGHTATSCEACHLVPPIARCAFSPSRDPAGVMSGQPSCASDQPTTWRAISPTDTRPTGERIAADLCRLPRPGTVPPVPPTECRYAGKPIHPADFTARHPVAAYSARDDLVLRLPQSRPVLPDLSRAERIVSSGRFIGGQATYHDATLTFAVRPRPRGAPGPRELRQLSRREGLPGVPFINRRPPLQSARTGLPGRQASQGQPADVHCVCHAYGIPSN